MRHPGALAFVVLFLSSVLAAQPPQPPAETLHVTSQMVVLDLVVTDGHGNVVTNCTPADFKVYEDGVLQRIAHFEPPAPDRKLPLAASIDHNGRQDWGDTPLTMIVMDEMNTPFSEFAYTREEVNRFLKAQPALLPQPTMVLWLNDSGFHSLTPFSRDRESLLTAVARHSASLPSKLMRRDDVERLSESFAALQQIALSARGSSAAKKIIWIGRGFPGVNTEQLSAKDQETFNRAVHSTLDLLLAARASVDVVDPTDLLGSNPEPVAVIGGDASDIVGLEDPATLAIASPPDPFAATFNFSNFAHQTGGHYFFGRNDIDREIASSSARANSFYTLSYTPSQFIQDGKYRKIDIRMSNPNLTATTKMGYYPGGDDRSSPTRKELGFDLYEASVTGMVYTGVGLHLQRCERDPDMIHANCLLGIDSGSLTFVPDSDGSYRAQVITAVSSVDAKSRLLYWTVDRVTFRVPSSKVNRIATGSGNLTIRAVIAPQAKAVRFVVRDSSGRIGTADLPPHQIGSLSASTGVLQQIKRERRRR